MARLSQIQTEHCLAIWKRFCHNITDSERFCNLVPDSADRRPTEHMFSHFCFYFVCIVFAFCMQILINCTKFVTQNTNSVKYRGFFFLTRTISGKLQKAVTAGVRWQCTCFTHAHNALRSPPTRILRESECILLNCCLLKCFVTTFRAI